MWEFPLGVGGSGWVLYLSKIGWRPSEARYFIDVVDQQMAQIHKIEWAPDRETARTGSWVLDTGVTEHGGPSLGVLSKDGSTKGVGRVSGSNERSRKHKIVSVSNANLHFCDRRTLYGSTPEGSAIGFDMVIIIDAMRSIDGWRR